MDCLGESDLDEMGLEVAAHSVTLELHVGMVWIVNLFVPKLRASASLGVGAEVLWRRIATGGALFVTVCGVERSGFADVIQDPCGGLADDPKLFKDSVVFVFNEESGFGVVGHFWVFLLVVG